MRVGLESSIIPSMVLGSGVGGVEAEEAVGRALASVLGPAVASYCSLVTHHTPLSTQTRVTLSSTTSTQSPSESQAGTVTPAGGGQEEPGGEYRGHINKLNLACEHRSSRELQLSSTSVEP